MIDHSEQKNTSEAVPACSDAPFDLKEFFPYLVHVFHVAVSSSLALVYTDRLGIGVAEWRTLATLGAEGNLSASEIVQRTDMDKVVVSRAIKGLQKLNFLCRDIDGQDKRRVILSLTKEGRDAFERVLPLVHKREQELLEGISESERQTLLDIMRRVRSNAKKVE